MAAAELLIMPSYFESLGDRAGGLGAGDPCSPMAGARCFEGSAFGVPPASTTKPAEFIETLRPLSAVAL